MVDEKNLVHNNMVPYFKSGTGKGYGPESVITKKLNDTNQRKITFSGSINDLNYKPKTERRPLFNPHVGLTWIYGTPNFTNYMESRYIPGKERRNEKLHQPVRVTPGLNKGYNEVSKEGFNSAFQVLPKTVDELRTANNPKISYEGRTIAGKKGDRRAIIPNVGKHRPIKFKEQDPRDMVKSLGYYRAQSIYGNYDVQSTNRQQTTKEWYGPVAPTGDQTKPESMLEKFRLPNKENFMYPEPKNITLVEGQKNTTNTANTYHLQATHRDLTGPNTYVPHAGPEYKHTYAWNPETNIPDPTRRDTTGNNGYIGQAGPEYKHTYAWNPETSIPDPTRRDITGNNGYIGQTNPGEREKGGYIQEGSNIHLSPTNRMQTQNKTYIGGVMPNEHERGGYVAEQSNIHLSPTHRMLTQKNTYIGGIMPGEREKESYSIEAANIHLNPNMRQMTQNTTYIPVSILASERKRKSYSIEAANIHLNPNMRQMTQNTTYIPGVNPGEREKESYSIEAQNIHLNPNMRQMTQNNTYLPGINPGERKESYSIEAQNIHLTPTHRQLTQNNTYLNPSNPGERAKGGYVAEQSNIHLTPTHRQLTQNNTYIRICCSWRTCKRISQYYCSEYSFNSN